MRICIFLSAFLLSISAFAQFDNLRNYSVTLIPEKSTSMEVEGDPYYETNQFQNGLVKVGENELNVFLRYDVGAERMEIKTDLGDSKTYQLPYEQGIEYRFAGKNFSINKFNVEGQTVFGYFVKYYEGSTVSLYGKPIATYSEGQKAKTGYQSDEPPSIKVSETYYVSINGEVNEVRPRKRDLRKIFDPTIVRDYLKENSMRSFDDLFEFIKYYDRNS